MCKGKVAFFPASKYNLSYPIVMFKLVGYLCRKTVLHTVRKFGAFEAFVIKNVNLAEVDVDEKDATFLHLPY